MAGRQNLAQPVLIFLSSAALITVGIWGFYQLEDQIAPSLPLPDEPKEEPERTILVEKSAPPQRGPVAPAPVLTTPSVDPNAGAPKW